MIRHHTHVGLLQYVKILNTACVFDLISSFIQFSIQMRPEYHHGILAIHWDGWVFDVLSCFGLTDFRRYNFFVFFNYWAMYLVWAFNSVPFVFRYFLVCHDRAMSNFEINFALGIVLFLSGIGAFSAFMISFLQENTNPVVFITECQIVTASKVARSNDPNKAIVVFDCLWKTCYIIMILSYVLIVVCSLRVFIFLRRSRLSLEINNEQVDRQINMTIILQTIMPLIFCWIPNSAVFTFARYNLRSTTLFKLNFIAYLFAPAMNPIVALLLISSYRRAIFSCWKRNRVLAKPPNNVRITN
ncbi:hypothetical protein M3Y95_01276600 [Aphelenchoides besseyi]|nr:hypothetical protein M3Y95_01276600 [Aphelenchoides besseyi]